MVSTPEYFTNGSTTSFLYNSDGIRTRKTTGNIMTEYFLNGDVLVAEKQVNTATQAIEAVIWYIYDDAGDILGLIYNGTPYYYLKNQQGDVISIVDADMNVVNSYTYDAWGKVMDITGSGTIGAINPIRYRGYYYDTESGLYYLQSRYYAPEIGRFINADDTDYLGASGTVLGYNLFAYCENNPVFYVDQTGYARTYSGIVGFGMQILLTASMLGYQGFIGAEVLWFTQTNNNNFGNGLIPWFYWFAGGSQGLTIDFSKVLSLSFLNNPQKVLRSMGLGFSCSVSISFFLIKAQQMSSPDDYRRTFSFSSVTTMGVTVSKASGGKISTYGVGFSLEKRGLSIGKKIFGVTRGASFYWQIPIGSNARTLYSYVQRRV